MIRLTEADEDMHDKYLLDTGVACIYDGEPVEYQDLVILVMMIHPYVVDGRLMFYDIWAEDKTDYLYEPGFFHGKNWDEIEEELGRFIAGRQPVQVEGAILHCRYCKSGILPGETTGVGLTGEIHRSQRNPDSSAYGNHFEPLSTEPIVLCIACMMCLNTDVQEIWGDGVCHDKECKRGTYVRCWRGGCPGNCVLKQEEDIQAEHEEDENQE